MGFKCCVPGCRQGYDGVPKNPNISMHKFPDAKYDSSLYEQWMKAIGSLPFKKTKSYNPNFNSRVCSLHFKPSDLVQTSVDTKIGRKVPGQRPKNTALVKK